MFDFKQKFLDHYYPYTPVPPQPANFNDAPGLSGTYMNTRSMYSIVDVVGHANGTLQITSPAAPNRSVDLVEVAPLVFANPSGNITSTFSPLYHYIFTTGSNGTYFHGDAIPQYFERLPSTSPPPVSRASDTSGLPFSSWSPSASQHPAYPMALLAAWHNPRSSNSSSTPPPAPLSPPRHGHRCDPLLARPPPLHRGAHSWR